jgi:hypothetical protein
MGHEWYVCMYFIFRFKSSPVIKEPLVKSNQSPPDAYLECIIREVAVTGHHAAGTCSGGTVVDNELRFGAN